MARMGWSAPLLVAALGCATPPPAQEPAPAAATTPAVLLVSLTGLT